MDNFSGALDWGIPIIADILTDYYAQTFDNDAQTSAILSATHRRFWISLVQNDVKQIRHEANALLKIITLCGVSGDILLEGHHRVVEELLDIVEKRYCTKPQEERRRKEALRFCIKYLDDSILGSESRMEPQDDIHYWAAA